MEDKIAGIEGLRVFAAILVASWISGIGPFHGGYVGLDVGFVIAGFFATRHIHERVDLTPRQFFIDIVAYRLRRVVPLTGVVSILTGIFVIIVYGYKHLDSLMATARSVNLFYTNFQLTTPGHHPVAVSAASNPFAQFWTISLLQQLVIAWAAIYLYLHRSISEKAVRRAFWAVVVVGVLASSEFHYFSVASCVLSFLIGALYSWYFDRTVGTVNFIHNALSLVGLVYIGTLAVVLDSNHSFAGILGAGVSISTVAIISAWAPDGAGPIERIFEFRPLSYLGRYTFAFYLWMFPGIVVLAAARHAELSTGWRLNVILGAAILAVLSHHFIEVPVLKWLDPQDDRVSDELDFKITYRGTAILIVVAVLFTFGFANMSHYKPVTAFKAPPQTALQLAFPKNLDTTFYPDLPVLRQEISDMAAHGDKASSSNFLPGLSNLGADGDSKAFEDCIAGGRDGVSRFCQLGEIGSSIKVVVLGDGHAAALAASLQSLAAEQGIALFLSARHGCRNNSAFTAPSNDRNDACTAWHQSVVTRIRELKPDVVILASDDHNPRSSGATEAAWAKGHLAFLSQIQEAVNGVRVADVGGWVKRYGDPVLCLKVAGNAGECATEQKRAVNRARKLERRTIDRAHSIAFIDMSKYFCTKVVCPATVNGVATMAHVESPSQSYMRFITLAVSNEFEKFWDMARSHYHTVHPYKK